MKFLRGLRTCAVKLLVLVLLLGLAAWGLSVFMLQEVPPEAAPARNAAAQGRALWAKVEHFADQVRQKEPAVLTLDQAQFNTLLNWDREGRRRFCTRRVELQGNEMRWYLSIPRPDWLPPVDGRQPTVAVRLHPSVELSEGRREFKLNVRGVQLGSWAVPNFFLVRLEQLALFGMRQGGRYARFRDVLGQMHSLRVEASTVTMRSKPVSVPRGVQG